VRIALSIGNPSQSYGALPAIWDHTVLPATRHMNAPHHNPSHAGRYLIYLARSDERLSWPWWLVIYRDEAVYLSVSSIQMRRKTLGLDQLDKSVTVVLTLGMWVAKFPPYAWLLKRGVNLGLVNPSSEGYPEDKSQCKFCRFWNSG